MKNKRNFIRKPVLAWGTGSALKDGGLQGDGLKAVLAAAVVFGRACGAASTTFSDSKMIQKLNQKSSQNGVCEWLPILLRNRAPMQVKQLFSETCLSMGTGSAFKGGLQGDSLKAVLATAVVFGWPAARPRPRLATPE